MIPLAPFLATRIRRSGHLFPVGPSGTRRSPQVTGRPTTAETRPDHAGAMVRTGAGPGTGTNVPQGSFDPRAILTTREVQERFGGQPRAGTAGLDERMGLHRLARGAWMDHEQWAALPRWSRARAFHHAIARTMPGSPIFCGPSAALLWGLPVLGTPDRPHVIGGLPGYGSRRSGRRVQTHAWPLEASEVSRVDGLLVTSLPRTAVDCARELDLRQALVIVDGFLRRGGTHDLLADALAGATTGRGTARARRVLDLADSGSDSAGETLTRLVLRQHGLSGFTTQLEVVVDGELFRLDFAWEAERLALEFDGEVKYSGRYGDPAEVIRAERRREKLLLNAGWRVIRTSWAVVNRTPQDLAELVSTELQLLRRGGHRGGENPIGGALPREFSPAGRDHTLLRVNSPRK